MSVIARQSTARTVMVGPILDADGAAVTDGVVGDLKISKNGGAPAALNGSATLTHRNTGHYSLALTTSDLDTVGQAEVVIDDTTNAMPVKVLTVIEEAVYDALFVASATGLLPANVTQFGGSNGTFSSGRPEVNTTHAAGTAWGSGAITAGVFASNAINAAKLDPDVTTELQTGLATAAALAVVDGNVDDIKAVTDQLPDGGSFSSFGTTEEIVAAVSIHTGTAQAGAAGTITLDTGASSTNDFYNDATVLITGGTGAGQVRHISDYVGSTRVAAIKPNWTTTPDNTSTFRVLPQTSPWDHVTADHLDSGSAGESLNAAGAAGDPWTTALPGSYTSGQAGKIVGDNLNATVSSRATQTSVDDLPTNAELATSQAAADDATLAAIAALNNLSAAGVRTELATELARIDVATSTRLAGSTTGSGFTAIPWNASWDAEVQSEAADALNAYDPPTKAELDTAVDALPTAVENATAVLAAAASNPIDANVQEINDVALTGDGSGTPWGPA